MHKISSYNKHILRSTLAIVFKFENSEKLNRFGKLKAVLFAVILSQKETTFEKMTALNTLHHKA